MTESILEMDQVTKTFGDLVAVDDLSIELHDDDFTALIGPNGSGKTTTYNLISGLLQPTSGRIHFNGNDVTSESPDQLTKQGIGRSFQITNIFEGLTAYENVRIPVIARSSSRRNFLGRVDADEEIHRKTQEVIELVGLEDISNLLCEEMAYGQKRRVEIAVTMATNPDLVLFDEPTAGMNPTETENMVDLLSKLYEESDTTFFITEHDMDVIFSVGTRILVLNNGSVISDGTPAEIQNDETVKRAYLGEEA